MIVEKEKNGIKRRSKGERTKHQILEATINVLAKKGIKGTTHRAIAKLADIQLSLTTYYFKDIEELIHQAIILNSEMFLSSSDEAWIKIFTLIKSYDKATFRKSATKVILTKEIINILNELCTYKIKNKQNELAVEQILFTQRHVNPALSEIADKHRQALLEPYIELCQYFACKNIEIDADLLLTTIKQIEFRYLGVTLTDKNISDIEAMLTRIIPLILKVKI